MWYAKNMASCLVFLISAYVFSGPEMAFNCDKAAKLCGSFP